MNGYLTITEGTNFTVRARPETEAGVPILRANVNSVTLHVFDALAPGVVLWEQALGVTETMATALQTGAAWVTDATGYTFQHTFDLSGDFTMEGGKRYRVEYELVLGSSPADRVWAQVDVVTTPVMARRET